MLRQEDESSVKEAELGWLLDRKEVMLRPINDAASRSYASSYRRFFTNLQGTIQVA